MTGVIAVTGSSGQLGRALCRLLGDRAVALPRSSLDVADPAAVGSVIGRLRPDAVINCAAWTAVDKAETEREAARAANEHAVTALASACREVDALLVQVSTDYVFGADAARKAPYREDDPTGPLGEYGASKLAGEVAARSLGRHQVVRTCGLYSAGESGPVRGRNFADTMLVLARDRPEVRVVADQFCTPSYVPHVAAAIVALLEDGTPGTFHATNSGGTSWHQFATELFRQAGLPTVVTAIESREYPSPVARPPYSILDTTKLADLGITLPDWRQGITDYLAANS
jgi:dTDP-4-dehydrorhamnose reductase